MKPLPWLLVEVAVELTVLAVAWFALVLADLSADVAFLGAVGTLFTVVLGALAGWWLKIRQQNATLAAAAKKADTAEERKARRDEIGELYRIIEIKDKDHAENRQMIHDLRAELQGVHGRVLVCEHEREELKREGVELRRRIEALEGRAK